MQEFIFYSEHVKKEITVKLLIIRYQNTFLGTHFTVKQCKISFHRVISTISLAQKIAEADKGPLMLYIRVENECSADL